MDYINIHVNFDNSYNNTGQQIFNSIDENICFFINFYVLKFQKYSLITLS